MRLPAVAREDGADAGGAAGSSGSSSSKSAACQSARCGRAAANHHSEPSLLGLGRPQHSHSQRLRLRLLLRSWDSGGSMWRLHQGCLPMPRLLLLLLVLVVLVWGGSASWVAAHDTIAVGNLHRLLQLMLRRRPHGAMQRPWPLLGHTIGTGERWRLLLLLLDWDGGAMGLPAAAASVWRPLLLHGSLRPGSQPGWRRGGSRRQWRQLPP